MPPRRRGKRRWLRNVVVLLLLLVAVVVAWEAWTWPDVAALARVGESDAEFDRRVVALMEGGDHDTLCALTTKELHATGSHELLNWMVLMGAVAPASARVRFFGEMGRIDLAAVEWTLP